MWSENDIDCCSYFELFSFISSAPKVVKSDPPSPVTEGFIGYQYQVTKGRHLLGAAVADECLVQSVVGMQTLLQFFREFFLTC